MANLQKAYLAATPLFKDLAWWQIASNQLVSQGGPTTVTAAATAHTKGSWTQIIASTASNASALAITITDVGANGFNTAALIDIGFGASGSETVKIADVAVGGARGTGNVAAFGGLTFVIPLQVPSGTRIACRIQGVIASDTASVSIQALDTSDYSLAPTSVDTIGGDTATSGAIGMSGASGTWVELVASTSQAYRGIVLVPSIAATAGTNTIVTTYEIGTGAAASEVTFGFINAHYTSAEEISTGRMVATPVLGKLIPAGTRIAVKHSFSSNQGIYQVTLIGIP